MHAWLRFPECMNGGSDLILPSVAILFTPSSPPYLFCQVGQFRGKWKRLLKRTSIVAWKGFTIPIAKPPSTSLITSSGDLYSDSTSLLVVAFPALVISGARYPTVPTKPQFIENVYDGGASAGDTVDGGSCTEDGPTVMSGVDDGE
ncbi:hypothetical protein DKX38_010879 [Salix brachista]|uniref:Uncharacterized protein n=1 Tax=Salix brachista TaxID=2182728 RepID=A0A5N5LZV1_9ROSI|nr:hypothetical protein DKX38_010879 [Salix brachista]